jgi:hypothetical protein
MPPLAPSHRVLTKDVLSFEERIAACESHFDFRADIVVVYGRRFAGFGMISCCG